MNKTAVTEFDNIIIGSIDDDIIYIQSKNIGYIQIQTQKICNEIFSDKKRDFQYKAENLIVNADILIQKLVRKNGMTYTNIKETFEIYKAISS